MTLPNQPPDESQLEALTLVFHRGAAAASAALEKWLRVPSVITTDGVDQMRLEDAATLLGADEAPMCCCSMEMRGLLEGRLILVFDETSGLALADLVLGRSPEPSGPRGWGDIEISAALETANVIGCAYLNSLHYYLPGGETGELVPSPPRFQRDYPEALLQTALVSQLIDADTVYLAESRFHVDDAQLDWMLLLVPDGPSAEKLRRLG